MENTNKVLKEMIADRKVVAAIISFDLWEENKEFSISLKKNHSKEELEKFFKELDFDYEKDCAYIQGTIWLSDGNWIERVDSEYGEYWKEKSTPKIPEELL